MTALVQKVNNPCLSSVQLRPDCSDNSSVCQILFNFPPTSELWDPGNWHLITISSPLQLSWLQHWEAEAECYEIYTLKILSNRIRRFRFVRWYSFLPVMLIYLLGIQVPRLNFLTKSLLSLAYKLFIPRLDESHSYRYGLTLNSSGTNTRAWKSVTNAQDILSSMRQYSLSVLAIAPSHGKN